MPTAPIFDSAKPVKNSPINSSEMRLLPEKAKCYLIILNSENREHSAFLKGYSPEDERIHDEGRF